MAFMVLLKSGEQVMINGAMIQNPTAGSIKFQLNNKVHLLRQRDYLELSDAPSPAECVYYESMRLSGGVPEASISALLKSIEQYRSANAALLSEAGDLEIALVKIVTLAADGEFYFAMVEARSLLAFENPSHPVLPIKPGL